MMLRRIKSYLLRFVTILLIIFSMHFVLGMVCRANPDPKVSDSFDAYIKPGVLAMLTPLLFLSKIFANGWTHSNILGILVYFGTMLVYSVLWTTAFFGIYKVLRKVITWKYRNKPSFLRPTEF